jgi:hypothetical protein
VINGVPGARDPVLQAGYGGSFSFFRPGEALDEEALLRGNKLPSYYSVKRNLISIAGCGILGNTR